MTAETHRGFTSMCFTASMMNIQVLWWILGIVLLALLGWYFFSTSDMGVRDEASVREVVVNFGRAMKEVPLLGPPAAVAVAMDEAYGKYVLQDLIDAWKSTPAAAPGRRTSSPWPDRITITSVAQESESSYAVGGDVVETTNAGDGETYPVTLEVKWLHNEWIITDFEGYPPRS
jgi:hypothetical protein